MHPPPIISLAHQVKSFNLSIDEMTAVCSVSLSPSSSITLVTSTNHPDPPLSDIYEPLGPNTWLSQVSNEGNPLSDVLQVVGSLEGEGWTVISTNQTASEPKSYNFFLSKAWAGGELHLNGIQKRRQSSMTSDRSSSRRRSTLKLGDPGLPSASEIKEMRLSSEANDADLDREKVEWAEGTIVVGGSPPAKTPPKELPSHIKNGTFTDSESDADTPKNRQVRTDSAVARAKKRESAFFAKVTGDQEDKKKAEAAKIASMSAEEREKYEAEMAQKAKHADMKRGHMQRLGMSYNKKATGTGGGRGRGRGRGRGAGVGRGRG
jgi:hypothetical protein